MIAYFTCSYKYSTAIQTHRYIIIISVVETTTSATTNTTGLKWITCNFFKFWMRMSDRNSHCYDRISPYVIE